MYYLHGFTMETFFINFAIIMDANETGRARVPASYRTPAACKLIKSDRSRSALNFQYKENQKREPVCN